MIPSTPPKKRRQKKCNITATCFDARGRILSTAKNNYKKSHPLQASFAKLANQPERIFLHAEIAALLKAGDKEVHTIVTTKHPCPVCALAIQSFGVKNVLIIDPKPTIND